MSKTKKTEKEIFDAFEKALNDARRKALIAQSAEDNIFQLLDILGIDAEDVPSSAENAENLKDAISCYLSYGEYSPEGILQEVQAAYHNEKN